LQVPQRRERGGGVLRRAVKRAEVDKVRGDDARPDSEDHDHFTGSGFVMTVYG
jgi:hypothetical protein